MRRPSSSISPDNRTPASRVLIVGNDSQSMDVICKMLRYEGLQVWTATSREEGFLTALSQRPEAVLVYLPLTDQDTMEFVDDLKSTAEFNETSVTIVTNDYYLGEDQVSRIKEAGANLRFMPLWLDEALEILGRKGNGE